MGSSPLPKLSENEILAWVDDERIFDRGKNYSRSGAICNAHREGSILRARCKGSAGKPYKLWVRFDKKGVAEAECSCPYDFVCKHLVALLLQWLAKPETFLAEEPEPPTAHPMRDTKPDTPIQISLKNLQASLAVLLKRVRRPGEFYAMGSFATILPRIDIEKVGPLSFPVPAIQGEQITKVAERAPYGKGGETLLDIEVRRVWQLAPQQLKIDEKRWAPTLEKITNEVAKGLGIEGKVQAELYKMLVYDKGSFFVPHRDTEKTPGMFGTLIVVLPSWYEGGELIVSHAGREAHLALPAGEASGISWAAFYADCLHELRPVTDGYRLALVYNLLRTGKGKAPTAPDHRPEIAQLAKLLAQWSDSLLDSTKRTLPLKLAYILEHHYTAESLSFSSLKNADAAAAEVLKAAAKEAGCALHLAMVSIEESGIAEYNGDGGFDDYDEDDEGDEYNDEDFEIIEVTDRIQKIEEWRTINDTEAKLAPLPFEDSEICPPGALEEESSDEVSFHEASGNEGASFERTYRRAALVLWPAHLAFAVINQGGLSASIPYLQHLIEQWERSKEPADEGSLLWQEANVMAGWLIRTWPNEEGGEKAEMLSLLSRLSKERLQSFFSEVLLCSSYQGEENQALIEACKKLGWEEGLLFVQKLIAQFRKKSPEACAELLHLLSQVIGPFQRPALIVAVTPLIKDLEEDTLAWEVLTFEGRTPRLFTSRENFVVHLMSALWQCDAPSLATRAAGYMSRDGKRFPIAEVLLPATLRLVEYPVQKEESAPGYQRMREASAAYLKERLARLPEPPKDWKRTIRMKCDCKDCQEIKVFMADATKEELDFRASEKRRKHVERSIYPDCDLYITTICTGSPHILHFIKNSNSYRRVATQRERELEILKKLSVREPPGG